jgi:hypothetical protein
MAATGTDGGGEILDTPKEKVATPANRQQLPANRQQYSDETTQETANRGERPDDCRGAETPESDFPQVVSLADFGDKKAASHGTRRKAEGKGPSRGPFRKSLSRCNLPRKFSSGNNLQLCG